MKGLTLHVYRNPLFAGCSNQGISERADKVTLVGVVDLTDQLPRGKAPAIRDLPRDCQVHTPHRDAPPVLLVKRAFGGRITWHVQPLPEEGWPHYSAGGSFVASSDSRVAELIDRAFYGAFAFHDRLDG